MSLFGPSRALLTGIVFGLAFAGTSLAAETSQPNVIVILSDDMGFSDLGCYGSEINTPNLDRLAAGGLRFTQFYNTARCCPTRACLLTGVYPHQASIGHMMQDKDLDGYRGDLGRNVLTIAEVLRPAGYDAYAVGKWHVTKNTQAPSGNWPLERGFERYYGIIGGAANYFRPNTLARDLKAITIDDDPEYPAKDYYFTDAISDQATRYIREHQQRKPKAPFFMYVAFTAAHWPMHAPASEIAKYKGRYDAGYDVIRKRRFERVRQLGLVDPKWDLTPQAGDWSQVPNKAWEARCMEVYAAMIDRMDQGIGRIVDTLRQTGRYNNTLVFFLQDNGACAEEPGRAKGKKGEAQPPMPGPEDTWIGYGRNWANVSNTPFREYKHWVHEGGISTPLVAHWPAGIKRAGQLEHQPGHLIDIMATCADVAGTKYPQQANGQKVLPMEGRSLVPAFQGKSIDRDAIFWEHEGNRAIRVGQWKLVAKGPGGPWELYDMKADRTEMHDLAATMPERVKEIVSKWEAWAKRAHVLPWPWRPSYGEPADSAPAAKPGKKKRKG